MPISGALLTKVNNALADIASRIETREVTYFTNHGRYWQGILTPSTVPIDGTDTPPNLTLHPTDQAETWADFAANLTATIPFSIFVFVHNGPDGQGFTMGAIVQLNNGEVWYRTRGSGFYGYTSGQWLQMVT